MKTTDEDLNVSYSFTDKQGHTVLTRQMNNSEEHDTYYIYNDKGNLCFVLQPKYQESADLGKYAFQYEYDACGRCTKKKLPGADFVEYTYNAADQLVFSQDGNQRRRLPRNGLIICMTSSVASPNRENARTRELLRARWCIFIIIMMDMGL